MCPLRAASLPLLLATIVACLPPDAALAQDDLSEEDLRRVEEAFKVLRLKSSALELEKDVDTGFKARLQLGVKAFQAVLERGDVKKGGLPSDEKGNPKVLGRTVGNGEELELDGSPGDGAGENQVLLHDKLIDAEKCSIEFLQLVLTIAHESVHLNQKLEKKPPKRGAAAFQRMLETNPGDLLDMKRELVRLEREAYGDELRMQNQLRDGLLTIRARDRAGWTGEERGRMGEGSRLKSYMLPWLDCDPDEIDALLSDADKGMPALESRLRDLLCSLDATELLVERLQDEGKTPREIAEALDKDLAYERIRGRFGERVGLHSSSPRVLVAAPGRCERFLDTGIRHPQDTLFVMSSTGVPHLIVCGKTADSVSPGIVRGFDLSVDGAPVIRELPGGFKELFSLPGTNCEDICAVGAGLEHPSSLLRTPDGRTYVWDLARKSLFPLRDDDLDGVPDRVELLAANRAAPQWSLDHFASVSLVGEEVILELRVGSVLDFGDLPILVLKDANRDGCFEATAPGKLSDLLRRGR